MKVIKRNQLVILVIGLMLVTAGYLNFIERQQTEIETNANLYLADLGDATLVSSGNLVEEENIIESSSNTVNHNQEMQNEISADSITNDRISENTNAEEDGSKIKEEETIALEAESDEYFITSKLQRDTMYSQMIESYQKMLDSTAISAEQKAIAQNEITKINQTKNAIMIAENLITSKGFKDVIVLVNDTSINVILDAEKLEQEEIAQVQNIISREMKAEIENIHISCK